MENSENITSFEQQKPKKSKYVVLDNFRLSKQCESITTETINNYRLSRTPLKNSIFHQNDGDCGRISILSVGVDPVNNTVGFFFLGRY